MHVVRDATLIDTLRPDLSYSGVRTAGQVLCEAIGTEAFVVGFTARQGRRGSVFTGIAPLGPPPPGSVEDLCARAGLGDAIIPLRGLPLRSPLRRPLVAWPLGYSPMRASWPDVFDALVVNAEQAPSTQRPAEPEELVAALDQAWPRSGLTGGDWTRVAMAAMSWSQQAAPAPAEAARAHAAFTTWAASRRGDPWTDWILDRIEGQLLRLAGRPGDAQGALLRVLALPAGAAGGKTRAVLRETLEDLGMTEWDLRGFASAIELVASHVEKHPSAPEWLACPPAWRQRLRDEGPPDADARLHARIRAAYEARAARLPAESELCRLRAAALGEGDLPTASLTSWLDRDLASWRLRALEGNPFAGKCTPSLTWMSWRRETNPSPDALLVARREAEAWARTQDSSDPDVAWRLADLRGHAALDTGDPATAVAAFTEALDRMPEASGSQPSQAGMFQHVHQRLACALAARDGIDAAIADLAKRLATDRRFRYWHDWAYSDCPALKLDDAGRGRLLVGVRAAYAERARRFPEWAEEIAGFSARLQ